MGAVDGVGLGWGKPGHRGSIPGPWWGGAGLDLGEQSWGGTGGQCGWAMMGGRGLGHGEQSQVGVRWKHGWAGVGGAMGQPRIRAGLSRGTGNRAGLKGAELSQGWGSSVFWLEGSGGLSPHRAREGLFFPLCMPGLAEE